MRCRFLLSLVRLERMTKENGKKGMIKKGLIKVNDKNYGNKGFGNKDFDNANQGFNVNV